MILRPRKLIGCIIAAVLIVVIGVAGFGTYLYFKWQREQRLARLVGEAPAQVLEVNVTSSKRRRSSRRFSTHITYRFEVNGRTIETEFTKSDDVSEDFAVGRRAKVCYDPAKPDDNEIFTLSYRCGQ